MGYGHVGSQVSILAESLGMKVVFFDVIPKLPMGLSAPCSTLDELLATSGAPNDRRHCCSLPVYVAATCSWRIHYGMVERVYKGTGDQ